MCYVGDMIILVEASIKDGGNEGITGDLESLRQKLLDKRCLYKHGKMPYYRQI